MGKVNVTQIWFEKTYEETLALLEESQRYHAYIFQQQTCHLRPIKRLSLTKESLRITCRLSHTMAWLICEKAILNNEIERTKFETDFKPLSEEKACIKPMDPAHNDYPNALKSLLERSLKLFIRAARLETMLRNHSPI